MITVEDYAIYSHILCNYQRGELSKNEKRQANVLTLLFLLSDTVELSNIIKKIENLDFISNDSYERVYTILKFCDQLFSIPADSTFSTSPGIINKIFFYLDLLNKFEKHQNTQETRSKLFEKIKEKIEQVKLDLYIMEKKLSPYDKKDPDFKTVPFVKFIRIFSKKLLDESYTFLQKNFSDEALLISLVQKKNDLIPLLGTKRLTALIEGGYTKGKLGIEKNLLYQDQKRGFLDFIKNHLTFLKNNDPS